MSGDHNQYQKPDGKCQRCGEVNPAEIHTCTPKREWQSLTDSEISEVLGSDIHTEPSGELRFVRAIEDKLREKNG